MSRTPKSTVQYQTPFNKCIKSPSLIIRRSGYSHGFLFLIPPRSLISLIFVKVQRRKYDNTSIHNPIVHEVKRPVSTLRQPQQTRLWPEICQFFCKTDECKSFLRNKTTQVKVIGLPHQKKKKNTLNFNTPQFYSPHLVFGIRWIIEVEMMEACGKRACSQREQLYTVFRVRAKQIVRNQEKKGQICIKEGIRPESRGAPAEDHQRMNLSIVFLNLLNILVLHGL